MALDTKTWTTASVPAGGSLNQSLLLDVSISRFWILKLQITPSASGGASTYDGYYSSAFSGVLAFSYRANSLSPFYDPVKRDASGNMSNEGVGIVGLYEDEDASGKLHIKIGNQAAVDRTYEVKIWYLNTAASGNFLTLDNTTPFTPDGNYEPATKKYVDDNVISGGIPAGAFTGVGILLVGTGPGTYQAESGATARASLGLVIGTDVAAFVHDHDSSYYPQAEIATLLDGYVTEALFDANTILVADDDNTPTPLAVAASRLLGRGATGGINDLSPAEVKTILGFLASLFDDAAPALSASLAAGAHAIHFTEKVLTSGALITWDLDDGNKATLLAEHSFTLKLAAVAGALNAQCIITQDGTGSRVMDEIVTQEDNSIATSAVHSDTEIIDLAIDIPTGARIRFKTSAADLPAPLVEDTIYWAIRTTENHIKVAASKADAHAGTAIDLTDAGSGTHTVQQLAKWMGGTLGVLGTAAGSEDVLALTFKAADKQWYAQLGSEVFS